MFIPIWNPYTNTSTVNTNTFFEPQEFSKYTDESEILAYIDRKMYLVAVCKVSNLAKQYMLIPLEIVMNEHSVVCMDESVSGPKYDAVLVQRFSDKIDLTRDVMLVSLDELLQAIILINDKQAPLETFYFENYNPTLLGIYEQSIYHLGKEEYAKLVDAEDI